MCGVRGGTCLGHDPSLTPYTTFHTPPRGPLLAVPDTPPPLLACFPHHHPMVPDVVAPAPCLPACPLPPSRMPDLVTPVLEPGGQAFVDLSYGIDGSLQPESSRVWQFGLSLVQATGVGQTGGGGGGQLGLSLVQATGVGQTGGGGGRGEGGGQFGLGCRPLRGRLRVGWVDKEGQAGLVVGKGSGGGEAYRVMWWRVGSREESGVGWGEAFCFCVVLLAAMLAAVLAAMLAAVLAAMLGCNVGLAFQWGGCVHKGVSGGGSIPACPRPRAWG